jgi:hypothetical protein
MLENRGNPHIIKESICLTSKPAIQLMMLRSQRKWQRREVPLTVLTHEGGSVFGYQLDHFRLTKTKVLQANLIAFYTLVKRIGTVLVASLKPYGITILLHRFQAKAQECRLGKTDFTEEIRRYIMCDPVLSDPCCIIMAGYQYYGDSTPWRY